jgi:hypothetical protein
MASLDTGLVRTFAGAGAGGRTMTEAAWLACVDPKAMLDYCRERKMHRKVRQVTNRKLRLFVVACCRQLWDSLTLEAVRAVVELNERVADKLATEQELAKARNAAHGPAHEAWNQSRREGTPTEETIRRLFFAIFMGHSIDELRRDSMPLLLTDPVLLSAAPSLLRDIFGNPFRPAMLDPAWRTSTVTALARGMYESRDFTPMPILADALQDARCDNDDILNHCRDGGVHIRGCWVVDLVLGKE